ncbi:hypothetical protein [Yinghuangia seranimata]|uniref:hypothetical protein n=1 Tax=Yinghuangia seranimata TaxID=408067 RepID=UPI00248B84CD|nr:hypothetical protein [Yinghuangia seranimata]MDI2124987.1 hypothetical protein [Yinghuangia seranimata]
MTTETEGTRSRAAAKAPKKSAVARPKASRKKTPAKPAAQRGASGSKAAAGKPAKRATKTATGPASGGKAAAGKKSGKRSTAAHRQASPGPATADRAKPQKRTTAGTPSSTSKPRPDRDADTTPVEHAAEVAAQAVALPIAVAQRVLPAKGGLPLYLGLGALGVVGVLEWPVAVGIGVGYAVLRRGGAFARPAANAARSK